MRNYRGYTNSYANATPLVAATPVQVVAAATNVRGLIVRRASIVSAVSDAAFNVFARGAALVAKATAPASEIDGDVIAKAMPGNGVVSGNYYSGHGFSDNVDIFVPPGKGLYFIATTTESSGSRSVLYELL